jgi:hypothetical protein
MKGFLSGERKMAHPHEDKTFFVGSPSSGNRRNRLLGHVEVEGSSQQRRPVSEVLHNVFT